MTPKSVAYAFQRLERVEAIYLNRYTVNGIPMHELIVVVNETDPRYEGQVRARYGWFRARAKEKSVGTVRVVARNGKPSVEGLVAGELIHATYSHNFIKAGNGTDQLLCTECGVKTKPLRSVDTPCFPTPRMRHTR